MADSTGDPLRGSGYVCETLDNCSVMHIWRLCNDPKYQHLKFPKPIKIMNRNYWKQSQIVGWISEQQQRMGAASEGYSK